MGEKQSASEARQRDTVQQVNVSGAGACLNDVPTCDVDLAHDKLVRLRSYLHELESVAVAFSGGVDSTFLLKIAHDELADKAIAITARSESFPEREWLEAEAFCAHEGITHLGVASDELDIPGFAHNPANRCYLCKQEFFSKILAQADDLGVSAVCEGSNMDDEGDFRPGLRAVAELGIKSPLRHAGLYKAEIRFLSHELGLRTWNKQSFACLASRFAYGEKITRKKLAMVDRAEQFLLDEGFHQLRVRIHGEPEQGCIARIEVGPEELEHLFKDRQRVVKALSSAGFAYVTMDLRGYRTGSMNEVLPASESAALDERPARGQ